MKRRTPAIHRPHNGVRKSGVNHWRAQRFTALALVPLAIWFVVALITLPVTDHSAVTQWIGSGGRPVFLALFAVTLAWHSQLGVQVVIEDYIHGSVAKTWLLAGVTMAHVLLAAAAVVAVFRIAIQGQQ